MRGCDTICKNQIKKTKRKDVWKITVNHIFLRFNDDNEFYYKLHVY